jgi:hypothetical protein
MRGNILILQLGEVGCHESLCTGLALLEEQAKGMQISDAISSLNFANFVIIVSYAVNRI